LTTWFGVLQLTTIIWRTSKEIFISSRRFITVTLTIILALRCPRWVAVTKSVRNILLLLCCNFYQRPALLVTCLDSAKPSAQNCKSVPHIRFPCSQRATVVQQAEKKDPTAWACLQEGRDLPCLQEGGSQFAIDQKLGHRTSLIKTTSNTQSHYQFLFYKQKLIRPSTHM